MADEETTLTGGKPVQLKMTFNIETLRAFGLSMGFVLLTVGTIISNTFVFGEPWGDMKKTDTYIYKTFNFNHTCSYLDWNPSRTVSAIVAQLLVVPMCIYIVLSYYRMKYEYKVGNVSEGLWTFCRYQSPFTLMTMLLFGMVFVNHPVDRLSFIVHYVPYMFFQMGLLLIAVEQAWYVSEKDMIPLGIPRSWLKIYLYVVAATFIYYTVFIWSFLFEHPILDTTVPWKKSFGMFLMFFWDVVAVLIPIAAALIERAEGKDQTIIFYSE